MKIIFHAFVTQCFSHHDHLVLFPFVCKLMTLHFSSSCKNIDVTYKARMTEPTFCLVVVIVLVCACCCISSVNGAEPLLVTLLLFMLCNNVFGEKAVGLYEHGSG